MGPKFAEITEVEREVIVENLIHDLAMLDSTTEAPVSLPTGGSIRRSSPTHTSACLPG